MVRHAYRGPPQLAHDLSGRQRLLPFIPLRRLIPGQLCRALVGALRGEVGRVDGSLVARRSALARLPGNGRFLEYACGGVGSERLPESLEREFEVRI